MNSFSRGYFQPPEQHQDLARLIASESQVQLEVGSGKGMFLIGAAAAHPETQFIGLERAAKYAALAQRRLEQTQVKNGIFFCCDAIEVMCRDIPENRLAAVHVYFPDPWWKARHKKRRVLNERMLVAIERALMLDGILHFWTDVMDYYESTLELLAQVTRLKGPRFVSEPTVEDDVGYRTHFERRTRLNGLPVYRCQYVKESLSN